MKKEIPFEQAEAGVVLDAETTGISAEQDPCAELAQSMQAMLSAIGYLREAQERHKINQQTAQREAMAMIRTIASTVRSMAARESLDREAAQAAARDAERAVVLRRRKAIRQMIVTWFVAAAICICAWIVRSEGLADVRVVYFVNAVSCGIAMYISGYLHGWGWNRT